MCQTLSTIYDGLTEASDMHARYMSFLYSLIACRQAVAVQLFSLHSLEKKDPSPRLVKSKRSIFSQSSGLLRLCVAISRYVSTKQNPHKAGCFLVELSPKLSKSLVKELRYWADALEYSE